MDSGFMLGMNVDIERRRGGVRRIDLLQRDWA